MDIAELIGNYVFPIAVCAWLLYERTSAMDKLKQAIDANTAMTRELILQLKIK